MQPVVRPIPAGGPFCRPAPRTVQHHPVIPYQRRININSCQRLLVKGWSAFLLVNPQHHRCLAVVGLQDRLPVCRMVFPQPAYPPERVIPESLFILPRCFEQAFLFAQKAAQAGIDEGGLRPRGTAGFGRLDCLVDQGERLIRCVARLARQRQRGAQQGIDGGRRLARGQLLAHGFSQSQVAQHLKKQGLDAGALGGGHPLHHGAARAARTDVLQCPCHGLEEVRERHTLACAPRRGSCGVAPCSGGRWGRAIFHGCSLFIECAPA